MPSISYEMEASANLFNEIHQELEKFPVSEQKFICCVLMEALGCRLLRLNEKQEKYK